MKSVRASTIKRGEKDIMAGPCCSKRVLVIIVDKKRYIDFGGSGERLTDLWTCLST